MWLDWPSKMKKRLINLGKMLKAKNDSGSLRSLVSYQGNTQREIPYLRTPVYHSLFILI